MEKKIRVLQVTSGFRKGTSGGIPSVLYNYGTSGVFDEGFQIDYLSLGYQTFEPFRQGLEEKGGNLYCLDIHSTGVKQLFDIYCKLRMFLKDKEYDIVHVNSGALTQMLAACFASHSRGIYTIAHSHNSIVKSGWRGTAYTILKPLYYKASDDFFACTKMAAECVFPKGVIQKGKWKLINNAIDVDRFIYDERVRKEYRKNLGIEDKFVVGHIGRFNAQKNHKFIIDVFEKFSRERDDAVLVLVGTGDLEEEIKSKVHDLSLDKKVMFLGRRADANNLMMAMDVLLFPSIYEGLGMVLIEAQTTGLQVISSNRVPIEETHVTNNIVYCELDVDKWLAELRKKEIDENRKSNRQEIVDAGYELKTAAEYLRSLYVKTI